MNYRLQANCTDETAGEYSQISELYTAVVDEFETMEAAKTFFKDFDKTAFLTIPEDIKGNCCVVYEIVIMDGDSLEDFVTLEYYSLDEKNQWEKV